MKQHEHKRSETAQGDQTLVTQTSQFLLMGPCQVLLKMAYTRRI